MSWLSDAFSSAGNVLTTAYSYATGLGEASDVTKALGIGGAIGNGIQNANTQLTNNFWGTWGSGGPGDPQTPSAQPTIQDANTTAIQNSLKTEQTNFWQRTNFTGGQGLLDTPTTASQQLLGS